LSYKKLFMDTFLFPTDFSPNAQHALDYTLQLMQGRPFRLVLMHSYKNSLVEGKAPEGSQLAEIMAEEVPGIEAKLNSIVEAIKAKHAEVKVETLVKNGSLTETLEDAAKKLNPYMLVMGTQGASGLKETIFGSNTAHAITRVHCPVLAIPNNAAIRKPSKILYAADLENGEEQILGQLLEFASKFGATTRLLHVLNDDQLKILNPQREIETLSNKFSGKDLDFKITGSEKLMDGIQEGINDFSADLLVLAKHKRGLIDKLFTRSYTKKLAYHSEIPLLALHKTS
jgi:nucleotide-binding universal stress UspA family protein